MLLRLIKNDLVVWTVAVSSVILLMPLMLRLSAWLSYRLGIMTREELEHFQAQQRARLALLRADLTWGGNRIHRLYRVQLQTGTKGSSNY